MQTLFHTNVNRRFGPSCLVTLYLFLNIFLGITSQNLGLFQARSLSKKISIEFGPCAALLAHFAGQVQEFLCPEGGLLGGLLGCLDGVLDRLPGVDVLAGLEARGLAGPRAHGLSQLDELGFERLGLFLLDLISVNLRCWVERMREFDSAAGLMIGGIFFGQTNDSSVESNPL